MEWKKKVNSARIFGFLQEFSLWVWLHESLGLLLVCVSSDSQCHAVYDHHRKFKIQISVISTTRKMCYSLWKILHRLLAKFEVSNYSDFIAIRFDSFIELLVSVNLDPYTTSNQSKIRNIGQNNLKIRWWFSFSIVEARLISSPVFNCPEIFYT